MMSASEAGRSPRASSETQSKRGSIMSVRFRPDERQRVAEAAGMFEVSPSAFVRAAAIDAVDAVRTASASADVSGSAQPASAQQIPAALVERSEMAGVLSDLPQVRELAALRAAVNKVGGNINQIARLANQEGLRSTVANVGVNDFVVSLDNAISVFSQVREVLAQPTGTVQLRNLTVAPNSPAAGVALSELTGPEQR